MKNLNTAKKSVLGNMIIRQTMGGLRKEDKIRCKDELIEKIWEEYEKQNSKETHKLNLTMLDVSKVEDMSNLFLICHGYDLESIDVSNWNVSNVKSIEGMFDGCNLLENIDVSKWNTKNIKYMDFLFSGCSSLKSVNISEWDVSNVEDMRYMFQNCSSLKSIDVSKWDVSNVKNMQYMFQNCSSLKSIDVSKWDVSNVKDMCDMFYGCNFDYIKKENKLIDIWRIWTV